MNRCHKSVLRLHWLRHLAESTANKLPAPAPAAFENLQIQFWCWLSYESKNAANFASLFDDTTILQSPLKRIRDGQVADFRRITQHFVSKRFRFDFIHRQHPLLEKSENVVMVGFVFNEFAKSRCRLKVRRLLFLDEDGVLNIKHAVFFGCVVTLVIHEHNQRVSESVDFLAGALEWTRRLRLADARDLDVNAEFWKINSSSGVAAPVSIAAMKRRLEFVFQISADRFAVSDAIQTRLCVLRFSLCKAGRFFLQQFNCELLRHDVRCTKILTLESPNHS